MPARWLPPGGMTSASYTAGAPCTRRPTGRQVPSPRTAGPPGSASAAGGGSAGPLPAAPLPASPVPGLPRPAAALRAVALRAVALPSGWAAAVPARGAARVQPASGPAARVTASAARASAGTGPREWRVRVRLTLHSVGPGRPGITEGTALPGGDQAAVDAEVGSGDVRRLVAGQHHHQGGDLIGAGEPAR